MNIVIKNLFDKIIIYCNHYYYYY